MFEKLLAKRHISHLDLSSVRASLVEKKRWTVEQTVRVEYDYKRFLYAMARKHQDDIISPPDQVDEFWHQHILDTRKYRADCDTIFGHYVDHIPGLGPDEQRRADARRLQVYQEYDIDCMWFESSDGGSVGADQNCGGTEPGHGHGHSTGTAAGAHACDTSGHSSGGHSSGGDSGHSGGGGDSGGGGGDGGGGDGGGGGCGGGGCGGGGCGGG